MRRVPTFLLSLFVVLAIAFAPATKEAWAQTTVTAGPSVTGILGTVQRCVGSGEGLQSPSSCNDADNTGNFPHPSGVLVNDINFLDCEANLFYQFSLGIGTPSSSYTLNAWVGTQDCSQLANRQTSAEAVCWPVMTPTSEATTNPFNISLRMQDIVSGVFATTHPVSYAASDSTVCGLQMTQTGATNVVLYLFFADGGSNPVGTVQQYPITVDMRAGDVQGAITAGVGDTVLIVSIPSTTDPDTQGWNVYCDPPPGQETATSTVPVDAPSNNGQCAAQVPDSAVSSSSDASEDAETDGATTTTSTGAPIYDDSGGNTCGVSLNDSGIPSPGGCSSSTVLVYGGGSTNLTPVVDEAGITVYEDSGTDQVDDAGVAVSGGNMLEGFQYQQPLGSKYLCASTSGTTTSINVEHLKDGYYYNIAVAAVDALGNVGPLSNVPCGEPVPVADFWHLYYEAGGRAGGGFFCSAEGVGVPAGTSGLGVLMLASIVSWVRVRKRRQS